MKSILFDLDGTLTDSQPGILHCFRYTLEQLNLPIPDTQMLRTCIGPPLRESLPWLGVPRDELERAVTIYRSLYLPVGIWENDIFPGIRELLEGLKQAGHTMYIATGKPESMAVAVLERYGLNGYFQAISGATMGGSRDTKAQIIAHLLDTVHPENPIMAGDTVYDIAGAKANGIPSIGVAWGYGHLEDMIKAGASAIAHTTDDLFELLK